MSVEIKRVRDEPASGDGFRVLVDRLWPRGLSKDKAEVDEWLKDVGPSDDLRKAFHHEDLPFDEFTKRYRDELKHNQALDQLRSIVAGHSHVTLLFDAKDPEHNQAVVLRSLLT